MTDRDEKRLAEGWQPVRTIPPKGKFAAGREATARVLAEGKEQPTQIEGPLDQFAFGKATPAECLQRAKDDVRTLFRAFVLAECLATAEEAGEEPLRDVEEAGTKAWTLLGEFVTKYSDFGDPPDIDEEGSDGFLSVTVVIDGALETEVDIDPGSRQLLDILAQAKQASRPNDADGTPGRKVEVFLLEHPHPPREDGECECSQYATDHNPAHIFEHGEEVERDA